MRFIKTAITILFGSLISTSWGQDINADTSFILIEGGTFMMGYDKYDKNERPIHEVYLNSFYLYKYEVTFAQFIKFLNDITCNKDGKFYDPAFGEVEYIKLDDPQCAIDYFNGAFTFKSNNYAKNILCPVSCVTWYGANAYCIWAGGRLPTEAEWEYAARGGQMSNGFKYSGDDNIDLVAWYKNNSSVLDSLHLNYGLSAIGQKKPNELGIYDMTGNIDEWCLDWYDDNYYSISPKNNPINKNISRYKVVRGGNWQCLADDMGVAFRSGSFPNHSNGLFGFRVAKNL